MLVACGKSHTWHLPSPLHLPGYGSSRCINTTFRPWKPLIIAAFRAEARRNVLSDISASSSVSSLGIFENQPAESNASLEIFEKQPAVSNAALTSEHVLMSFSEKWHTEDEPEPRRSAFPSQSEPQIHITNRSEGNLPQTMIPKLGQCFNSAGISFTLKVIFREPQVALPHISVPDITWIDWKALKESGFEGVVFDKDNTLTAPYGQTVCPSLTSSLEACKTAFEGRVALLSNSAGLYQYDPDGMKAKAVEDKLGVPVIRHGSKKPAGSAEDLKNYFGCDASLLVMVGDRHLTDIVYGNKNGLLTIITKPLTLVGEPLIVRQVRTLEGFFVRQWYQKGLLPVQHKLFSQNCSFVRDPSCR